jgi:myo-inositol-1(or 4)-monophosphatase
MATRAEDIVPLTELERIARDAGALGVSQFGQVAAETKADGTLVTAADRSVQRLIVRRLRSVEPDPRRLFILAEEHQEGLNPGGATPKHAEVVAAVDPLDGTTSFAAGLPLWTVSLGLLRGGRPVAGVVYAPLLGGADGWLYRAGEQEDATRNGAPLSVRPYAGWETLDQIGVPSGFHRWARVRDFGGKLRSLGSTAHHLSLVAAGGLGAVVVGRAHLWDLAGALPILERAGGVLQHPGGAAPDWEALLSDRLPRRILVAGPPAAAAALAERVEITARPRPRTQDP